MKEQMVQIAAPSLVRAVYLSEHWAQVLLGHWSFSDPTCVSSIHHEPYQMLWPHKEALWLTPPIVLLNLCSIFLPTSSLLSGHFILPKPLSAKSLPWIGKDTSWLSSGCALLQKVEAKVLVFKYKIKILPIYNCLFSPLKHSNESHARIIHP